MRKYYMSEAMFIKAFVLNGKDITFGKSMGEAYYNGVPIVINNLIPDYVIMRMTEKRNKIYSEKRLKDPLYTGLIRLKNGEKISGEIQPGLEYGVEH